MNIYLYPPPNKNSRFFDEYYSALMQKSDETIKVRILEPQSRFGRKLYSCIISRFVNKFPRLLPMLINCLTRNDRGGVVHFTTQLSVQPHIKNRFIFTYHDVLHMQPQWTGRFYGRDTLDRIDYAYKKAALIVTVSEFSKKLLQLYYPCDKKIAVVPPPIVPAGQLNKNMKPIHNHILFVGSAHPRKNLLFFLESIALMKEFDLKVSVVCRLSGGQYYDGFSYLVNKLGLKNLTLYESVSTQVLDELYASASVFCFPTLTEGFGMPPVEAQMRGIPVIASDIPICHEVLGDSCLYFNPLDVDDIREKIRMLIEDRNEEIRTMLIEKGYQNAKKYDIDTSVTAQFEVYRECIK